MAPLADLNKSLISSFLFNQLIKQDFLNKELITINSAGSGHL